MQIKATGAEASVMFRQLYAEKQYTDDRFLMGGAIALDSVRDGKTAHKFDGSNIVLYYKASGKTTERAKKEASTALSMGLPREMFIGTLIDIKENKDQQVYFLVRALTRQDENGKPCFRAFNPTKGDILEIIINPEPAVLNRGV